MKIYEKKDFTELPSYIWDEYNKINQSNLEKYGVPIFLVRVGVCVNNNYKIAELHKRLFEIKEENKNGYYLHEVINGGKCIRLHVDDIYNYSDMSIDDMFKLMEIE